MKHNHYYILRRLAALAFAALCLLPLAAQDIVRVTGKVISKTKREPLMNVMVRDTQTGHDTYTDEDGRFAFDVHGNTTLLFSMIGAPTVKVKLHGRQTLEVELDEQDISLGEATVTAKRITDKVTVEHTAIEVHGDTLVLPFRFRVPDEMISPQVRVIVQPVIKNLTRHDSLLLSPAVYDARTYNLTQHRMYFWDMEGGEGDPLAPYIIVRNDSTREEGKRNDIVSSTSRVRVANVNDSYSCDAYLSMENYNRILFRDSANIANGVVNPLRWLDYRFASSEITDPALYPKEEVQMRDSRDRVNFRFPVGKAALDTSDPQNAVEVERLRAKLNEIQETKGTSVQRVSMICVSSPEGRHATNTALAQRRAEFATGYLKEHIPASIRGNAEFSAKAEVATWADVAALMRADSLETEAAELDEAVKPYRESDAQWRAATKLPFYRSLLLGKYLPQLRRVDYSLTYTIFRRLTVDEIKFFYDEDYTRLSRYEFFRLYRAETDSVKREQVLRRALEQYPSFMVAANDLQAQLITRGAPEDSLLRRFAGRKAPVTVNANHTIALLSAGRFAEADTLMPYLPDTDEYRALKAVTGVLNGRVKQNYSTVAGLGQRNEVVMLLYMKENEEALAKARKLPTGEAMTHYLLATCLNRFDDKATAADDELKKAIKMDPSLRKVAKEDADLNTLPCVKGNEGK